MTRDEKAVLLTELTEKFGRYDFFYVTDSSTLPVSEINDFRRFCFEKGVEVQVIKNALIKKALERIEGKTYSDTLLKNLKGPSTVIFSENSNLPAKVIKEFRTGREHGRPILKVAYIDSDVFVGDDNVDTLIALKSKSELIGELIGLLQSPAKNVVSALQSGGNKLAGIIKTLSEKEG
jgi:large subunit ribosomal protein L10